MKSAVVALVGRPSSGKSTLVNALCGNKVSAVSPVPQTTRRQVRGIANRAGLQLILLDTPGLYQSNSLFNLCLRSEASRALEEADLVLYVVDRSRAPGPEESAVREIVAGLTKPVVIVENKIDLSAASEWEGFLLPLSRCPRVRISALSGEGLDRLWDVLESLAPEGPQWYPPEYYTDQEVSFRVAEIIREQAFLRLKEELPHSIFVEIADLEEREGGELLWIRAFIVVDRESQVGIVVGKGGAMIKEIRLASQRLLSSIFERRIHLDLRVKAHQGWRTDKAVLERLFPDSIEGKKPRGKGG